MQQPDKKWEAGGTVYRDLESCTVAPGFALVYQVATQVIKHEGSKQFLHAESFHSGVRGGDFCDADKGPSLVSTFCCRYIGSYSLFFNIYAS